MICYFVGENEYAIKKELTKIKRDFLLKNSKDSCVNLDEESFSIAKFEATALSVSMFDMEKLIVVNNLSQIKGFDKKEFEKALEKVSASVSVCVTDAIPPKKGNKGLEKLVMKLKGIKKDFYPPRNYEMTGKVLEIAKENNIKIENAAAARLAFFMESDLFLVETELAKLASFVANENREIITTADVEALSKPKLETNAFALVDAIASKNEKKAYLALADLLKNGQAEPAILASIVFQFRNLLLIKDLLAQNFGKNEIITQTGLHSFVVEKTLAQCKNFTLPELKKIYRELLNIDYKIKSGKIYENISLDLLIAKICNSKTRLANK